MRGYPILPDDIGSRLAQMETRLTRLEQPHNLNYAKQLAPVTYTPYPNGNYASIANQPVEMLKYIGRIYGPSVMFHICGQGDYTYGGDELKWELVYKQYEPIVGGFEVLASGSIPATIEWSDFLYEPSDARNEYVFAPTVISLSTGIDNLNIEGTLGELTFNAWVDPAYTLLWRMLDNGFIGPDYEHVVA